MKKKELGLYIHIPFCMSKCRYCDFCSFPHPKKETVEKYISSLFCEIEECSPLYKEYNITSVYFGGGTPTLLSSDQLKEIYNKLSVHFEINKNAEVTTECNPATVDKDYLMRLRECGFNRISIGVQSMNDRLLKKLGRLHTADDAKKTFLDARDAGFENISADIMFGLPDSNKEELLSTIENILALDPAHISLYGLKIEDGTYFARHKDELMLPSEDEEYEMYISAKQMLEANGLKRYEISNFAKNGYQSRHNKKYWLREDYLGLGLSAHSCVGPNRFSNTCNMEKFVGKTRVDSIETLSEHDILCEKVMLGMRLDEGIDFSLLGEDGKKYQEGLERYIPCGYVTKRGNTLSFTDSGMYISNSILSELLDFDC